MSSVPEPGRSLPHMSTMLPSGRRRARAVAPVEDIDAVVRIDGHGGASCIQCLGPSPRRARLVAGLRVTDAAMSRRSLNAEARGCLDADAASTTAAHWAFGDDRYSSFVCWA